MSRQEELKGLITEQKRRLQKLKEQQARKGIDTPPHILTEIEDIEAELVELRAELEALPQIVQQNPYRGLSAFREEDADVFWGRETFTAQLVASVQQKPLVAVLGPSGSGKSSIVFAGLIPRLRHDDSQWLIASFRPGSDPFMGLASALVSLLDPDISKSKQIGEARDMATRLHEERSPLSDYIGHIHQTFTDHRPLLIVDQFEELYTLTQETRTRQNFLNLLLTSVDMNASTAATGLQLLFTLRADFLGQAMLYAPLGDALQHNIELLGPMNSDELRMAIEKPTDRHGVSLELGLVERILDDIENEPGNLPLLEFALTKLWEQQQQGQLTHAAYEAIGRVEGALSSHADKVFEGLSEADQEQARRLFLRLVQPGEGAEDTRRLVTKAELGEATWSLVQRLADGRLVVTDRDPDEQETVEVAHEALIRGWKQLRNWIDTDRPFLTWQKRLHFALEQWRVSERDEGALLRGAPLAEAEGWRGEREAYLDESEQQFIQASVALRDRKAAAREAQRQRELKTIRRLRWLSIMLGTVSLLVVLLLGRSWWSSNCLEFGLKTGFGIYCQEISMMGITLLKVDLSRVDLRYADLNGAYLKGVNLNMAYLVEADLREADLSLANLGAARLDQANLGRANLSGANLSGANLSANLSGADLSRANLAMAYLFSADLSDANLTGADLLGAYMENANLRRADLSNTRMEEADLSGADLNGADLSGANLTMTNLIGADLSNARLIKTNLNRSIYNDGTEWPHDFDPKEAGAIKVEN